MVEKYDLEAMERLAVLRQSMNPKDDMVLHDNMKTGKMYTNPELDDSDEMIEKVKYIVKDYENFGKVTFMARLKDFILSIYYKVVYTFSRIFRR